MAYRKAKCIELHDANTAITTSAEQYALTAPAGRVPQASRPGWLILPADLAALARRLGLNVPDLRDRTRASLPEELIDSGAPVFRAYYETPANMPGVSVRSLECDVQGPNLVEIRIESRLESSAPELPNEVEVLTYSGAFTIWWEPLQTAGAEQLLAQAEAHPVIPVEGETPTEAIGREIQVDLDLEETGGANAT